ncbi:MAG: hypothetical protein LBS29_03960 [Endomicrobium sp.]|uniref:hypothetical protein n=1 Tax=Candidatus Endomicrobiellum cubanum TaxID=3242325 RepID=UPI00281D90EA|nr:hypothetical protein [Endomicrobium sp.]MDR2395098.1 hypothetical protein [Endomicrobium sp.]
MIIDIFLVISLILIAWLGWQVGLVRSCFAVLAGFCSIVAASKYLYQEGLNFYYIFIIVALFIIVIGGIVFRLIRFFYLNILDRLCGLILSVLVWLIVSVNIIIPIIISGTSGLEKQNHGVYTYISTVMKSKFPILEEYVPDFLEKKFIEHKE